MPTELEDDFIRTYFGGHDGGRLANSIASARFPTGEFEKASEAAGLIAYAYPDFWRVTPRGMDLLQTARAIGYDPDASKSEHCECPPNEANDPAAEDWRLYNAEGCTKCCTKCGKPAPLPATRECATCKGEGRVPVGQLGGRDRSLKELVEGPDARGEQGPDSPRELPGWDVTCGTCKGAKVVPVRDAHAAVDMFFERTHGPGYKPLTGDYALIWHDPASLPSSEPAASEWIDFTCLADVEGWEGATIAVRHRDGEHHEAQLVKEIKHCRPNLTVVHGAVRSYSSHAGWQFRKLESTLVKSARAVYDKLQAEVVRTTGIPAHLWEGVTAPSSDMNALLAKIAGIQTLSKAQRERAEAVRITVKLPHDPFSWTVDELREAGASRDLIAERKAAMLAREYEQRAIDEHPGFNAHVGVDGTTYYTPNAALVERDIVADNPGHARIHEALALGIISRGEADDMLKALNE